MSDGGSDGGSAMPIPAPLRMLGDASVPVCVDDACVVPAPNGTAGD